jgi:arylsulfatase A-like enzyme
MYPKGMPSCINNFMDIEDDAMNLPAQLRRSGYSTGYVGKYHLTRHDLLGTNRGWERAGLQTYPEDADPRTDPGTDRKMKANQEWWQRHMREIGYDVADAIYPANLREMFNDAANVHNVEWTADAANRFLKSREGKEEPFFLCVATTYNHGPLPFWQRHGRYVYSLDADVRMTGEGVVTNRDLSSVLAGETRAGCRSLVGQPGLSEQAPFAKWWDAAVGSILNTLEETGAADNTLVIYISDHGLNNHGKSTLYETGIHVPLLMKWPGTIDAGRVCDHVVGSIDLVPTVLQACGVQIPKSYIMDGRSLMPVLEGSDDPVREALFIQMGYAYGIKTDDWKYIAVRYPAEMERTISRGEKDPEWTHPSWEVPDQPYLILHYQLAKWSAEANPHYFARNQLFNLQADPEEKNNLFRQMPEKAGQMKQLLRQKIRTHIPHRPFGEFNGDDADVFGPAASAVWRPQREIAE